LKTQTRASVAKGKKQTRASADKTSTNCTIAEPKLLARGQTGRLSAVKAKDIQSMLRWMPEQDKLYMQSIATEALQFQRLRRKLDPHVKANVAQRLLPVKLSNLSQRLTLKNPHFQCL